MSKAPAMPMYWDAYLADTTHLTTEEHGAYLLLLAAMWRRNGAVPDDDKDNARILGLTPAKWRKIKARLSETISGFRVSDGVITQEKLQKTWKKTQEIIEKNRENGARGGRPKSKENKELAKATGSVSVNPNETIPEPEPEPEVKREAKASPKRGRRLPLDWVLPKAWGQWAVEQGLPDTEVRWQADQFKDYWHSLSGQKAVKLDWEATWRNWIRKALRDRPGRQPRETEADRMQRLARELENERNERANRLGYGTGEGHVVPLLSARRSD